MRKNLRKQLSNFYDTNQSEEEGYAPSTASSSKHSQHVTIVLEESPVSSISNPSVDVIEENFPKLITIETPTLRKLEEAVAQTKRTLQHIDALVFQAVWKCILPRSQVDQSEKRRSPKDGLKPLSVRQRRAQLAAGQTPSSAQLSGLRLFSSKSRQGSYMKQASSSLPCAKPFLPTSRFPEAPPLNPKERAQFNHDLHGAIEETRRSGLIHSTEKPKLYGNMRVRSSSLRSIALKLAIEKNNTEAAVLPSNQKSPLLVGSSVSLLILEVARKRALAVLFLRQLRLRAYQRRLLLEEFQWRRNYCLQWNTLRRWCTFARVRQSHKRTLLKRTVDHWQIVVECQKRLRTFIQRFLTGINDRLRAIAVIKETRQRFFFLHWRSKFTKRRVMCAMSSAADSFRFSKDADIVGSGGAAPRKQYLTVFSSKDGLEEGEKSRCSHALRCAYGHWKGKTEERLKARFAESRYVQFMKWRVFEKLKQAINRNKTSVSTQATPHSPSFLPMLINCTCAASELLLDATGRALSQRFRTVNIISSPPEVWCHKDKMAFQVAQTTLIRRIYRQWHRRYLCRRGGWYCIRKIQFVTMRRWMDLMARRRLDHATCHAVLNCWREKLHRRRLEGMATSVCARNTISRTFYTWRLNFTFRSRNNIETMRWCLQQWWERAALQIGARTLAIHHRQRLFYKWRTRTSARARCRALLLLADTLRETILLVGCIRVWWQKVRDVQKTRTMCGIIEQLNLEHRREVYFLKWKRKVFKTTLLSHVVTVSGT
ncbi:unnamed protein product [Phytomonas sp. EM1]|nr:unnamed protein product [Phytomonas sp. EM1]|eukprot:CCW61425.1 unnamed protein product [Phytomonas sp. isolate EM1]